MSNQKKETLLNEEGMDNTSYGIYDRPGPTGRIAEKEEETTVSPDVPVSPSPQMANQLSVDRPPIEDEDYVPSSTEELSRAAAAIAQLTPNESIEFFYRKLHNLLDDATDKAAEMNLSELEDTEEVKTVKESLLRRSIRNMLSEARWDDPDDEPLYGDDYEDEGLSVIDPLDAEYDFEEPEAAESSSDGMSLEDLAAEFGYSGPPGVRQELERITDRMQYFATKVKKEDLEALMNYAAGEYIDALSGADLIDDEDVEDLRKSPSLVKELDSFRFFFVGSFVFPAYKQVTKEATKKVKKAIEDLGVPKELQQTVFNQVTGAAARKPALIKKKVAALVKRGDMSEEEGKALVTKIVKSQVALKTAHDPSDDLVQRALDKWQAVGKSGKIKMIKQSLEQTLSDV